MTKALVCGVDLKPHEFRPSAADEFLLLGPREPASCRTALALAGGPFD